MKYNQQRLWCVAVTLSRHNRISTVQAGTCRRPHCRAHGPREVAGKGADAAVDDDLRPNPQRCGVNDLEH